MSDRIVLVGGRADGREITVDDYTRHRSYRVPEIRPVVWAESELYPKCESATLDYVLARDPMGWPSRDDQGRLRYVLAGRRM
jgi:hypothetical protein